MLSPVQCCGRFGGGASSGLLFIARAMPAAMVLPGIDFKSVFLI
jgi:hypothetical protein